MTINIIIIVIIADLVWAGEGYSAFAVVQATVFNLTVAFVDADSSVKYAYTIEREYVLEETYNDYYNRL